MSTARIQSTADGAILFDPRCAAQAEEAWFDPAAWHARGTAQGVNGGRGGAVFIDAPWGPSVLRHYRRGGAVARLLGDSYLWTGAERTRCFAEFRLLQELARSGLPVPLPVAARYQRRGAHYRADLIVRRIESSRTLAELLREGRCDPALMARIGGVLAAFHERGVYHADLNAHNVLLAGDNVYLIDFDRGTLRRQGIEWQLANLARLRRSLLKLGAARDVGEEHFDATLWQALTASYESQRRRAPVAPVLTAIREQGA